MAHRSSRVRNQRRIFRAAAAVLLGAAVGLLATGCFLRPKVAPLAAIEALPLAGQAPLRVRLDASASTDADGIVVAHLWTFTDGAEDRGTVAEHTFNAPGTYQAWLTVRDDDGLEATVSVDIVVEAPNVPPTASFTFAPSAAIPHETVSFDAGGSLDPDGAIARIEWDLGDGTTETGATVDHAYAAAGLYEISLTVTDDAGAQHRQIQTLLVVESTHPPVAVLEPVSAARQVGEPIAFDASASSTVAGSIVAYAWDFGDGTSAEGAAVQHAYAAAGAYRITLIVTDDRGTSSEAIGNVYVGVAPPGDGSGGNPTGDMITRTFRWWYTSPQTLEVSIPAELYAWSLEQPRDVWPYPTYDEYVLNTRDDEMMRTLAGALKLACYYKTIANALAFVQAGVTYQPDPVSYEYPRYPAETLVEGVGDCEDSSILYASILRSLGYGALLVAVDTDGDSVSDHVVVFVPVGDSHADYGIPVAWEYRGRLYAFAETATEGGYTPIGNDPWGLDPNDIQQTWDVSRVDTAPQMVKRVAEP